MKRMAWFSIVVLLFLAVGCSSNDEGKHETNGSTTNEHETENEHGQTNNENSSHTDSENNDESIEVDGDEGAKETDEMESPAYEIDEESSSVIPIDDADEDVVLITIDDAPDEHAIEMAQTLKDLDVNAIFFVNGHFLETEEEKEMVKKIHDMGFLIGNHTYSHPNLSEISPEEQREEIVKVSDMVEDIIGERPAFFRAPHGINTDTSREVIAEENMVLMNWTYGYDYFEPYMDKEKITEAMISGEAPEIDIDYSLLKPGANLLMHDREWTNAALKDIITGLRDKGYEMVDPKLIKTNQ